MSSSPIIVDTPLAYAVRLQERPLEDVDMVVVHCTELPDLAMARRFGERVLYPSGTGNSGHFYIDRDGSVYRYVPETRIAHHVRGFNARAIGIELVNTGRYPHWLDSRHQDLTEPYPAAQIEALIDLIAHMRPYLPRLCFIAGHDALDQSRVPATDNPDIQLRRKRDPGPLFPWPTVSRAVNLKRWPLDDPLSDG